LLSGLIRGRTIEESALLGSVCASFAVEGYGTQEYRFTHHEFSERFTRCCSGQSFKWQREEAVGI